MENMRSGGQILVECLENQDISHVYCVPGESYLAVLDALHDASIKVIVCRQEGGAAMMAEATARVSGGVGVAFVTRGPGATNASPAVHIAEHDSTPMILFVGQVERGMLGRGAFQEMDYKAFFGSTAKWVVEIEQASRIPEIISRAFHVATQGRPGPVVIALPEDVLVELAAVKACAKVEPIVTHPAPTQIDQMIQMLEAAKNPVMILGGSMWDAASCAQVADFATRFNLPVATSFRRANLFSSLHPNYAGEIGIGPNPKLLARIEAADLVIVAGSRMAEMPSQSYTLFGIPEQKQKFIHIHASAEELGRVYHPTLGIHASPRGFAAALVGIKPTKPVVWKGAAQAARAEFEVWGNSFPVRARQGFVDMVDVVTYLRDVLPLDVIQTNGAGNYAIWPGRYMPVKQFGSLFAPVSGSMGYGIPAAVAAKLLHPERMVVSFAGDGCFLMNGQEFATAVQYGANILVIVVDNAQYGTIRMHQEREYPARVSGTQLKNPDFAALARAYGGHGEMVLTSQDFAPAFERAVASGLPSILHLKVDPEVISPNLTLQAMREKAGAKWG